MRVGQIGPVVGLCFLTLSIFLLPRHAGADEFDDDYDEKSWAEIALQLPAPPEKENLIAWQVGAVTDPRFFIDGRSISLGADGVIRYTVVAISSAGAQNVSFEGMRCATRERRLYAFGRPDKSWSKARSNQWVGIRVDSNNYQADLYANVFCTVGVPAFRDADDVRRILREGRRRSFNLSRGHETDG